MGDETKILTKLTAISETAASNPAFARDLSAKAIAAILNGTKSTQWAEYMTAIVGADSPKQLQRLTFNEPLTQNDDWLKRSNVYIVANAVCGTGTTTRTRERVDVLIDQPFD